MNHTLPKPTFLNFLSAAAHFHLNLMQGPAKSELNSLSFSIQSSTTPTLHHLTFLVADRADLK